ncbi:hypothetical protein [Stutzerimonas nitrititolerans]|uniref:hypothetical protein n=1 Tax=Stutzerimonas nitrititolerans TaxID=2482751 RepID=UPI0028985273|nr:hypothetical protein [Stutzerimonas nitrititolerans]
MSKYESLKRLANELKAQNEQRAHVGYTALPVEPSAIIGLIAEVERLAAENECLRVDNSSLRGSCKALGDENKHLARRASALHRAVTWLASTGWGVKRPVWLERILAKEVANG